MKKKLLFYEEKFKENLTLFNMPPTKVKKKIEAHTLMQTHTKSRTHLFI